MPPEIRVLFGLGRAHLQRLGSAASGCLESQGPELPNAPIRCHFIDRDVFVNRTHDGVGLRGRRKHTCRMWGDPGSDRVTDRAFAATPENVTRTAPPPRAARPAKRNGAFAVACSRL